MPSGDLREALRRLVAMTELVEGLEAELVEIRGRIREMAQEIRGAGVACEECRRPWLADERGWEAHRVDLDELAFYCPECAEGQAGQRSGE